MKNKLLTGHQIQDDGFPSIVQHPLQFTPDKNTKRNRQNVQIWGKPWLLNVTNSPYQPFYLIYMPPVVWEACHKKKTFSLAATNIKFVQVILRFSFSTANTEGSTSVM